ncbi:hypothetical protein [Hymenobacter sp. DG25B]|uniref:hypothetical protein n=1 Tax=Hymenobacter sp. DG25B TaxID=1385664 RepID=UPI0012DFE998|nr:hypothetical protein [Hymenobacter sp. DG25B]
MKYLVAPSIFSTLDVILVYITAYFSRKKQFKQATALALSENMNEGEFDDLLNQYITPSPPFGIAVIMFVRQYITISVLGFIISIIKSYFFS